MTRIRYTAITSREFETIANEANLSETQRQIMKDLCSGDLYEYAIADRLRLDPHALYRQKKLIDEKCLRVLPLLGKEYLVIK